MPAKDVYHNNVKTALEKDGWTLTHDPLVLQYGAKDLFVDLGAQRVLAAEKKGEKIAVEIKSFIGKSQVANLEQALGQYILYCDVLQKIEPDRSLYLAVNDKIYSDLFLEPIGQMLIENNRIKLLVFNIKEEVIVKWIE